MKYNITAPTAAVFLTLRRVRALGEVIFNYHKLYPDFSCNCLLIVIPLLLALTIENHV